ncbi:hypothetical protein K435DRAFT_84081 [Dendrothele bispora CBS 962.96]|uniref:Uncharacterized protein n=1 Tax=Dendrothele bispora (strain CBS 962.96) TaxID=1314807 RepID=A0A4S8M3S8_DENBC|nr:hypothetical protein K435DRAFT_84081 [Dendrothele bispora CBS 962.96]
MSFPNDPKRPRGNASTGTNPQSQQHLRTWPLRIASWMSQQCLEQYSNMSTQDVVQQFRTYFDQWFTVIEGADSLNKERRFLYAKNNCSQNLVVLAVVLACRINDVPEARQYPNILDAARRVLSSYWGPEYRGSLGLCLGSSISFTSDS